MDLISYWLIYAVLALANKSNAKSKGKGEAWMIKSNLVGEELSLLDVQKFERPTTRSEIAQHNEVLLKANPSLPTREPGLSSGNLIEPQSELQKQDKEAKKSKPIEPSTAIDENKFIIKVDDQDVTDSVQGRGRSFKSKPKEGKKHRKMTGVSKKKKNIAKNIKLRQEIESNPEIYPGEKIGRPYGDPDGYQTIGDGIYLMSTEQEAALNPKAAGGHSRNLDTFLVNNEDAKSYSSRKEEGKTAIKKMPEPSAANLPAILTNLDKKSAKRHNGTQFANEGFDSKKEGQDDLIEEAKSENDVSEPGRITSGHFSKVNGNENASGGAKMGSSGGAAVGSSEPSTDMDAMTPVEMKALEGFQDKLGQEDKVIGKLILTKKVDKGQLDFIKKTNDMLQKENQQQIDNVFEKYKNEESNFINKNPYVEDKPKLLETIKNTTYEDVGATKRAFLGTNDNLRVEKMYNSLLKEDEMISNGLNEKKAEARKAISRHKENPEDEQVSKFLAFLEKEDRKAENGVDYDDNGENQALKSKMKKRKEKKKKKKHTSKNLRLLVIEPSLGTLPDEHYADRTPAEITEKDLTSKTERKQSTVRSKKARKSKGLLRKTFNGKKIKKIKEGNADSLKTENGVESKGQGKEKINEDVTKTKMEEGSHARISLKEAEANGKTPRKKVGRKSDSKISYNQIKIMEIGGSQRKKTSKGVSIQEGEAETDKKHYVKMRKSGKKDYSKMDRKSERKYKAKVKSAKPVKLGRIGNSADVQENSKVDEGRMTSELYASSSKEGKKRLKIGSQDKEYFWHGTVKPETRQLPTDPTEQMKKLGRISNIMPVSFEAAVPEGIGQVIGDSDNIANVGTATKETSDFGDANDAETESAKGFEGDLGSMAKQAGSIAPILNKIDENDISSTSFFSASKPREDTFKDIARQGIDPMAQKLVSTAINVINENELEKANGIADKDSSKILSMFDPSTFRPKVEEYVDAGHKDDKGESYKGDEEVTNKHTHGSKKHKLKIVLHLPEQMEGNLQDIHGKDSEVSIGTIKDMTLDYTKNTLKAGLGQQLAEDDEDTLEGILSKPTAKLEEFKPQATIPSIEYVPESVQGRESNDWNEKGSDEKETTNAEETGKERNDYVDSVKSNKLLSMIKHSEELLQKELGRHQSNEEDVEGFVSKAKDDSYAEELGGSHRHEQGESKSITMPNKGKAKNKKKKNEKERKKQSSPYQERPSDSPNIFADQINYEQKSKEVSQEMPTETVNKIKQIFNADNHLMPINFLLEDQRALANPGAVPFTHDVTNKPTKSTKALKAISTTKKHPTNKNPVLSKNNPLQHLIPGHNNLHIEGGKVHGGTINGGFIGGGDIEGGDIEGGVITGGKILGGVFKDGRMEDGVLENGTVLGGVIKGGKIVGGMIKAGLMAGGTLKGGEIEGGKMSGGEVDGGVLKSGEVKGGTLKSGSIEGGILRGGIIEGGHLLGGVMLGGKLKGGVVKSGVIKGGTIEGGVVDGGVIEDGVIIKGGVVRGTFPRNTTVVYGKSFDHAASEANEDLADKKAVEDLLNSSDKPTEILTASKPTSAEMYKINVDTALQDHNAEGNHQGSNAAKLPDEPVVKPTESKEPINIGPLGAPESWPVESKVKAGKQTDPDRAKVPPVSYTNIAEQKQKPGMEKPAIEKPAIEKPAANQEDGSKSVKAFVKNPLKTDNARDSEKSDEFTEMTSDSNNADQKSLMMRSPTPIPWEKHLGQSFMKNYGTTTRATIDKRPAIAKYHWSLNSVRSGRILGSPGKSMSVIGGIKLHNGIATLNDGLDRGYLDAGDYQGECISDPDVCKKGLTLSLTSKVYKDSLESPTRLYLFDSGAGSEDSKGMAVWVNKGKIEGAVSTRKGTWCLGEDLGNLGDRWVDYVMTWHPMKGLYLYANCELLAVSGFGRGCDVCTRSKCHQQDKNTHLMFGRPNKGPHFRLTHFSAGDITIYEDFFNIEGVTQLCGTNNDYLKRPKLMSQRLLSTVPIKSPHDLSAYVMKKQNLASTFPEFTVPSLNQGSNMVNTEFELWPTPSGLHSLSALFSSQKPAVRPVDRKLLKVDGGYSDWSSWTSCIGACGGTSMSTRYCNNPVPKHGGSDCSELGSARRTRQCDESNCLAPENVKAIARFEQSESADIESDISKRKEISRGKTAKIDQEKDLSSLKEEFRMLKHR